MNLGKGFSIPRDKGVVIQNADILVPITPEKPDLQRLSNVQSGVLQSNQIGEDKWGDLLGLYSGLLQNEASSHGQPHKSNTNSPVGVNRRELIGGVAPVENCSRDIAPVGAYNRLIQNFNSGLSNVEHNSREVGTLQRFRSLNHNGVTVGSGVQSLGEVAAAAPQKVNSLAELLCVKSGNHVPSLSYGAPNRRTSVVCDSTTIWPYSQVERNQAAYASVGAKLHQDHVLHINGDRGGYNHQYQKPGNPQLLQCPYR